MQIHQKAAQRIFTADPCLFQVQNSNRMKFNTQFKTHLSSSPHTVHLLHIDKSHDTCHYVAIAFHFQFPQNYPKNPDVPITLDLIIAHQNRPLDKLNETTRSVTLYSIVTLKPPAIGPNVCYRSQYYRLVYFLNQPKSTLEIHGGEVCSSSLSLQCLLYPAKRVGILFCPCIETSKINAESKGSIFLSHQYHCIAPGRLARPNSTSLQHVSK